MWLGCDVNRTPNSMDASGTEVVASESSRRAPRRAARCGLPSARPLVYLPRARRPTSGSIDPLVSTPKEGNAMADPVAPKPRKSTVTRRSFLKTIGVAGAAVGAAPAFLRSAAEAQETPFRDPAAKRGGTLRYGVHTAPAHFDVHQSGTVANIGAQSPMYDTLIRRDPRDGQTIIPDLAWKWEVAPDGKKYTFHLRKGVKFHDGADLTAEDVKATYQRIVSPPKGVVIPRSSLFTTVNEIAALDPLRIEFRL